MTDTNKLFNFLSVLGLSYPGWLSCQMMGAFESFPEQRFWGVYVPSAFLALGALWYVNKLVRKKERRAFYQWVSLLLMQMASIFLVVGLVFVSQAYEIGFDARNLPLGMTMVLGINLPFLYLVFLMRI